MYTHELDQPTCPLDGHPDVPCSGEVSLWYTDTGTYARCETHGQQLLDAQERAREYASDAPPSWFDETYAGERWDDDY